MNLSYDPKLNISSTTGGKQTVSNIPQSPQKVEDSKYLEKGLTSNLTTNTSFAGSLPSIDTSILKAYPYDKSSGVFEASNPFYGSDRQTSSINAPILRENALIADGTYTGKIEYDPNYSALKGIEDSNPKSSLSSKNKEEIRGLQKDAAAVASKKSDASKETPIGGNSANVVIDIGVVAKAARLSVNDIVALQQYLSGVHNINLLAAWIYMLYNGSGCVGKTVSALGNSNKNDQPITISGNMLTYMWTRGNDIIKGNYHKGIVKIFKKTPAYKDKFFEDVGEIGTTLISNADQLSDNPMTGSAKHTPSLLEKALNKIHPKFSKELEKYINVLKGKVYLALPANVLGSIQYAINYINGIITHVSQMINEIYQGCLQAIQDFVAMIDSIMGMIMQQLLSLVDQIIPLEIICLILDVISLFAGDLTFITNLFSHSAKFTDLFKTFNLDVGPIGDFLSDPVDTLKGFLPENVKNVIDVVDSVANDPMGYLGSVLNEYGYGYMMNYLKGDIMGGVLSQFGSQAPILYPISGIMKKYGFKGQIQLTDPNEPSPNVIMPPAIIAMRKGIRKTFDNLGNSIDKADGAINEQFFNIAQSAAKSVGQDIRFRSNNLGFGDGNENPNTTF